MKVVQLKLNDNQFVLSADAGGMFNLNTLHAASGTGANKRPGSWLRTQQTLDLIKVYSDAQICATVARRGGAAGTQGTWAIEQLVYAYAAWISAEFHAAVIEAFKAAVAGKAEKAVAIAQTAARSDSILQRKQFASLLGKHGADRGDFRNMTDTINIAVLGSASSTMKTKLGLTKSARLRNYLGEEELAKLTAVEALASMFLTCNKERTHGSMREAVSKAADVFKGL